MRFSRIQKKFFAACLAIFMFVGEVGNLPTSYALAIQTYGEQIVVNAANSNIPAPKTEERVVVHTGEEGSLPIGGVLANQTDGEQSIENVASSNIPAPKTEESIVVSAGEDESEGEDQGEEALTKDAKISSKVFSNTSGDENSETIDNIVLQELGDSDIPFVKGPNGAGAKFVIEPGTEKHLSFTIPEDGFSRGSYVIVVDTVDGKGFSFPCTVTDSESQQLVKSYYFYNENNSSSNVYFTLEKPGTYQFNVFNVYFENKDSQNATLSSKVYKTIEPPSFGVTEKKFTEPFDLTFTNIPEGCNVYYYINDYSHNRWEDTLYDPQNPAKINTECNVYAYCKTQGESGTLTSAKVHQDYYPDIERATCSVSYTNNIVESGDSITLTTQDSTLSVYYILESDWMGYSSNYIKENGTLYTGPIKVEGQENKQFFIYFITVNSSGVYSGVAWQDFTIGTPPPPVPEFSPDKPGYGDKYNPIVWESPTTVTVTSKPDTSICYSNNENGMPIEDGMEGVYTTSSNTLTLDVDHDMYVEVSAYDEEKKYTAVNWLEPMS